MIPSLVAAIGRRFKPSLCVLLTVSQMQLRPAIRAKLRWLPTSRRWLQPACRAEPQVWSSLPAGMSGKDFERLVLFSSNESGREAPGESSKGASQPKHRPLNLMDFPHLRWPHPIKTFRNFWMSILVQLTDKEFSMSNFLAGAEQAVSTVSECISQGRFDDLEGLVTDEAMQEVAHNFQSLTDAQRKFLVVNTKDIFLRFVYEVGMIFDNNSNRRFVEVTTVFQGLHGYEKMRSDDDLNQLMQGYERGALSEAAYICNYRFIREFTKGIDDAWVINKLNHFRLDED